MSPEVIASIDAIKVNMNVGGMNVINIVLAFVFDDVFNLFYLVLR